MMPALLKKTFLETLSKHKLLSKKQSFQLNFTKLPFRSENYLWRICYKKSVFLSFSKLEPTYVSVNAENVGADLCDINFNFVSVSLVKFKSNPSIQFFCDFKFC